jgi:hypothetical protein
MQQFIEKVIYLSLKLVLRLITLVESLIILAGYCLTEEGRSYSC